MNHYEFLFQLQDVLHVLVACSLVFPNANFFLHLYERNVNLIIIVIKSRRKGSFLWEKYLEAPVMYICSWNDISKLIPYKRKKRNPCTLICIELIIDSAVKILTIVKMLLSFVWHFVNALSDNVKKCTWSDLLHSFFLIVFVLLVLKPKCLNSQCSLFCIGLFYILCNIWSSNSITRYPLA